MEEKRKFVRIAWPIIIRYKTLEEPHTGDQIVGKDISEGGVSFNVYERLVKGTILEVQIYFPSDTMPIFGRGEVVWIKRVGAEHAKSFEAGVAFTYIEPRDQKRLKMYIENEMQ